MWPTTARANYLVLGCLILLGLALLVCAGAIAQRAHDLLLASRQAGDDGTTAIPAAIDQPAEVTGTIIARPVAPPTVSTPSAKDSLQSGGLPAKPELPDQIASKKQQKKIGARRRYHGASVRYGYRYRYDGRRFQPYWGPVVR